MRVRAALLISISAISLALPTRVRTQTPSSISVSSAVPQAVTEFRAGWADLENLFTASAAAHFKAALDRDGSFGLARVFYASTAGLDDPQLTSELNRGVADAAKGSTAELLLALAVREQSQNHAAQAQALFRASADLMPNEPFIVMRATTFLPLADSRQRLTSLQAFQTRFPNYGPLYNTMAYTLWASGDHAAALEAAKKQVDLTPKNPNAHDTYAELLEWNGDFAGALTHYGHAVSMTPTFAESYIGLAEVEALQGHGEKAREYINQGIAHAPDAATKLVYMRDIVGVYGLEGNLKGEINQLEAVAREAEAQNNKRIAAIAYAQMANLEANQGNVKAAHDDVARATAAQPAVSAIASYFIAMAHAQLHHWQPATAAIAAAKAAPEANNPGIRGRIAAAEAYIAANQNRPTEALSLLANADTTDLLVLGRLAEIHAALGHADVAAAMQQRVANDYQLNLVDFPAVNARVRARKAGKTTPSRAPRK